MRRKFFLRTMLLLVSSFTAVASHAVLTHSNVVLAAPQEEVAPGSLQALDAKGLPKGLCPLKQTNVKAEISGFLSRVRVTQEFENPFKEKIEAVYVFPLPQNAAVDDMTMLVGDRTVRGRILRREEAQAVYEAARANGQVAGLLDQERPNVFTQSVANIMPGEKVTVTISYVETLKYEDGSYQFVFPMVVAPRYVPGTATSAGTGGTATNTTQVPDASKITPPLTARGTRTGQNISVEVSLDAGVPIDELRSNSHEIDVERPNGWSANVRLKHKDEIPNKDFVLKYDVASRRMEDALLTHRTDKGGFFTFIIQPPDRVTVEDVTPKEIVFVLDTSGSMGGFPIEKAKEAMKLALDGLYPRDTFNLITFAGDTHILFEKPVPANAENLQKAQAFLESRTGGGGTEMMTAIKAALDPSDAQDHIRIVCFMTDGEVGNDFEIISEVQKHPNARVFAFGIGSSINRFLLDKVAEEGRGEVEYVGLKDDGSAAARRFHERIRSPLLTDISVEWNGLPVTDIYPRRIPDLFSAKPVVLTGRYTAAGRGTLRLKGKMSGRDFVREIQVDLPEADARHDVLATLWARTRIDDLMSTDYRGVQQNNAHGDVKETITQLGLEYRLMTQYTSFVAVEEMTVTEGGQPRRIEVPLELPEGMNRNSVDGTDVSTIQFSNFPAQRTVQSLYSISSGASYGRLSNPSAVKNKVHAKSPGRVGGNAGAGTGYGGGGGAVSNTTANVGQTQTLGVAARSVDVDEAAPVPVKLSPEQEKRQQLVAKLNPVLVALIDRVKDPKAKAGADEARFVRDGKAEIQVWLTDKSDATIAQLKQLGFEIVLDPKTSKMVIGRLPIENLAALAELKFVRYLTPQFAR
ncbi:MAG: Ca-activated chloride channel [Acidobacteriota bacterium]|nr:Ca-activated chloride channel [Acidobacteriota bacterium]